MSAKPSVSDKRIDRERLWDLIIFCPLFFIAFVVTYRLFLHQALEEGSLFPSDMKAYILEIQGLNDTYSFPYPILFWTAKVIKLFTTPERAMALATALLNGLAMIALKWEMNKAILWNPAGRISAGGPKENSFHLLLEGILISVVSIALFFVSMLILPGNLWLPGVKFRCIGVFTPNPFYNATYMAARPFAIVAFFSFCRLLTRYEKEENYPGKSEDFRECLVFSLSLLLSTMAKPSFTIVLVGAAGLNMLLVLFGGRFQKLRSTILLGLCFIPTFIALLYQYSGVFVSKETSVEAGIGFCVGEVWHVYCTFVPSAIVLGMGFPVMVLIFHLKEAMSDKAFRFSWEIFAMSFLMAYFLYEKGFRKNDFNFAWGYMYGIFFGFIGALLVLIKDTRSTFIALKGHTENKRQIFGMVVEWLAFIAHVTSGLIYFSWLSRGASYF